MWIIPEIFGNDTGAELMSEELELDMEELCSAEEFLDYFQVPYELGVVQVNRLHILQRFHDYLEKAKAELPQEEQALRAHYRLWLEQAYQDFVASDARTEKVFRVFRRAGPQQAAVVPLSDLTMGLASATKI
jgi:nitrogenase-stabilizing/protective protein